MSNKIVVAEAYKRFEALREKKGVTNYKLSKDLDIVKGRIYNWEKGISMPNPETLTEIADYLDTTVEYLMRGVSKEAAFDNKNTQKDVTDIHKTLNQILEQISQTNDPIMFDGEILNEKAADLAAISLENAIRTIDAAAKEKYTPKKYRKD